MTKTKMKALAAGVLLAALALTACAPKDNPPPVPHSTGGTTSASPTVTPSPGASVPPPANADEAKARAWDVVKAYWAMADEISRDKGANPDRIKALANGGGVDYVTDRASAIAQAGFVARGGRSVTMASAYTSDLITPKVANGFVGMKVCNDVNGITWYKPDGTPDRRPDILRSIEEVDVTYDASQSAWRVTAIRDPQPVKPC